MPRQHRHYHGGVPYWVTVTVAYGSGKHSEAKSHMFDTRDAAVAELAQIKKAQETWHKGSAYDTGPYEDALGDLPDWLVVHNVGSIVSATVEGSG